MKQKLLFLLFTLFFSVISVSANTEKWSDNTLEVTPDESMGVKIYRIESAEELAYVARQINAVKKPTENLVIILEADIDLGGKEWTPILFATNSTTLSFKGNYHTISNLTITENVPEISKLGLFGQLKGEISDLTLTDVKLTATASGGIVGALIGKSFYVTIKNCHVSGEIHVPYRGGSGSGGGLVGDMQHTTVDGCSADIRFTLCKGTVSPGAEDHKQFYVGGIAGWFVGDATVLNCETSGTVTVAEDLDGDRLESASIGGIGNIKSSDNKIIIGNSSSKLALNVTGITATTTNVGGLMGSASSGTLLIKNSYYNETITPPSTGTINKGGLVGNPTGGTVTFDNCFYPNASGLTAVGGSATTTETEIIGTDLNQKLNDWITTLGTGGYLPWGEDGSLQFTEQAEADTDYKWDGDVCTLNTQAGLLWFADQVSNMYNTFTGKTVKLASGNWDMSGEEWIPIGGSENTYFVGTFDGNKQTVTYKIQNAPHAVNKGFFNYVKGGTIQDVTIDGEVVSKGSNTGIAVAKIEGGTIANVTSKGSVTSSDIVGGIVGVADGASRIMNCTNEAIVTGTGSNGGVGGISGVLANAVIKDCKNSGKITGIRQVGGISGIADTNATIDGGFNSGAVEATNSGYVGGIVGYAVTDNNLVEGDETLLILNSINTGEVKAPNGLCAGGVVGYSNSSQTDVMIVNCGNSGNVSGSDYVSGIGTVEAAAEKKATVDNCFSNGTVASSGNKASLVVYSTSSGSTTVNHCFYKGEEPAVVSDGGETGLTTTSIASIPPDPKDLANLLNKGTLAFAQNNPTLPALKGWTNKDGGVVFGIPSPVIEGETTFANQTSVTITAMPGLTIRYTTDGTEPTAGSTPYSTSFTITETTTVKAIVVDGAEVSEVSEKTFIKQGATPPPYIPTYYTVTIPAVEGATTTPKAGDFVVEEGYNFTFSLVLKAGYENSKPVVKANGVVVDPRESDGKYILRNVTGDMTLTIEGIESATGNVTIEGVIKVRTVASVLHLYLPKEETVLIYTASGMLYKEVRLSSGDIQVELSKGVYFVKIAGKTYKIVI